MYEILLACIITGGGLSKNHEGIDWFDDFVIVTSPYEGTKAPSYLYSTVKVEYDSLNLYVKFKLNTYKGRVFAQKVTRDDFKKLLKDETFFIFLNPNKNSKDLLVLAVNVLNTQFDFLRKENASTGAQWDATWYSEVRKTENGWEGIITIPFNIYENWSDTIRFAFFRYSRDSLGEQANLFGGGDYRYPFDPDNYLKMYVGKYSNCKLKISLLPYASLDWENNTSTGGDIFYSYGAYWNGAFSINPDYAEVEADPSQFDFSRVGIYLPEKRPFFKNIIQNFEVSIGSFGEVFYSRKMEEIKFGHYGAFTSSNVDIFSLFLQSDTINYFISSLHLPFKDLMVKLNGIYDDKEEKVIVGSIFYNKHDEYYAYVNGGKEIDRERGTFYDISVSRDYYKGLNLNLRYSYIGDIDIKRGYFPFKNIKEYVLNLSYILTSRNRFMKQIQPQIFYRKILTPGDTLIWDYKYASVEWIIPYTGLEAGFSRQKRKFGSIYYNNENKFAEISLYYKNLRTSIGYSFGENFGENFESYSIDLATKTINDGYAEVSYYNYNGKSIINLFWTQRFFKTYFVRVFLEKNTFNSRNKLNFMLEKDFSNVNSRIYFVINTDYPLTSKYFNLPQKDDIKYVFKVRYNFEIK